MSIQICVAIGLQFLYLVSHTGHLNFNLNSLMLILFLIPLLCTTEEHNCITI